MQTCLVVANQTLPSEALAEEVRRRVRAGDRQFYVVVPLLPATTDGSWDDGSSANATQQRLDAFVSAIRDEGVDAHGEIGDPDPIQAVQDVMDQREVDEIILSTLPPGISRWLQMDVPSRMDRAVNLPVTVVTQELARANA